MTEIISWSEARSRGLKRYFTGKPCKHGHVCERKAANGNCWECDRALARRSYQGPRKPRSPEQRIREREKARKRRQEHPQKEKERKIRWRASHQEQNLDYDRSYYQLHHERIRRRINERRRKQSIALRILKEAAQHDPNLMKMIGEINDAVR